MKELESTRDYESTAANGRTRDGVSGRTRNVLRAKTGALIVVGYSPEVMEVVDGGFSINCDFSPNYLYELAKMDGAIILSEDREANFVCEYAADSGQLNFFHQKQVFGIGRPNG